MKDSGIPWIGEIPEGWTIELIGNQVKEVDNPNSNGKEKNALQFKMGSIISKSQGNSKYNPETLEEYNIVDKGVIMLNGLNLSFDFISQRVGLVRERGVITSTYLAVKPTDNIDSEYLTYLFKAYDNCKAFHSMGKGLRQTLSYGELRKYLLIYPSLAEQRRIAEFLDRKCAEVDEMIALQEQIIEELKAYKQSVITEAVTKGLNPAAPMRDSGIEWIGQIPEHWTTIRIKYLLGERKERSEYGKEEPLSMSQKYGLIPTKEMDTIPNMASSFEGAKIVYPEDLVFNKLKAHLGVFATSKYNGLVSPDYAVYFGLGRALMPFMEYMFKTPQYISEFRKTATGVGSGLTRLYTSDLFSMPFPLPSIEEQGVIVTYIKEKCADIDSLIQTKQSKIDSLREYKKSIIYEYVTGKREVE